MENKLKLLKELLERFKAGREVHEPFVMSFEDEIDDALEWAIEQAVRVHGENHLMGLEGMYADCNRMVASQNHEIKVLQSKNKRYREVIKETLQAMGMVDRQKYGKTLELALEESE